MKVSAVAAEPVDSVARGIPEIEWCGVTKAFTAHGRTAVALENVSCEIRKGERVALTGRSGGGKTTLLNMVAGLIMPTSGVVRHAGRDVTAINNEVGYVTQKDTVLPWRTVERNTALALEVRGAERSERRRRVAEVLELVGLTGAEHLYPSELSGGMLKRLLLARTLVYRPSVLLLDEPFAALDAHLRAGLHAELIRIWEATGATIVLVTHDLNEAVLLSDRVLVLGGSPSHVVLSRETNLPAGADPLEAQFAPAFTELTRELWHALRGDDPRSGRSDEGRDGSA